MAKRCCANLCYNSTLTNKSVNYFGFPKSELFARKWAEAAGRDDLLEKPLQNIIKYYLCSAHFTNDCFTDSPTNSLLRKTIRPTVVPIPTIFKSNIDQYMPPGRFVTILPQQKSKPNPIAKRRRRQPYKSPPKILNSLPVNSIETSTEPQFNFSNKEVEKEPEPHHTSEVNEHEQLHINEESYEVNVNEFDEQEVRVDEDGFQVDESYADIIENEEDSIEATTLEYHCRLCAEQFSLEETVVFFNENMELLSTIRNYMPNLDIVLNDSLPQQICVECYEKVNQCVEVMSAFERVQDKFYVTS